VPSVRFSRDKRGYEYVYLVHTPIRRGKPGRTRVLYWYRTPPGVRIGRRPFDEEVQRMLERQNPGVEFAWDAIINTPMPPPDMTEYWRERRRAEKAARQERRASEAESATDDAENSTTEESPEGLAAVGAAPELNSAELAATADEAIATAEPAVIPGNGGASPNSEEGQGPRRRRRRRGGRRRRPGGVDTDGQSTSDQSTPDDQGTPRPVESQAAPDSEGQSDEDDSASEEQ